MKGISAMNDFGFTVENSSNPSEWKMVLGKIDDLLNRHGYVLLRNFDISQEEFYEIAQRVGTPVQYGFGNVLEVKTRDDTEQNQFKNGPLPLHQDSILNHGEKARYLAFKCLAAPGVGTGGETLLTNNRRFFEIIPSEFRERLQGASLLYKPNSPEYYKIDENGRADGWIEQKAIVNHPTLSEEVLFISLDGMCDSNANCMSRFSGFSESESETMMREVDTYLRNSSVLYQHDWRAGDILIVDNYLVCHGRNAYLADQPRHLVRLALS